jgi:hypothetical protein
MTLIGPAALYAETVLREAPRVLGLMDREPQSPTRGCCDRTWWAWKFTDFPGARFQEALCALGFLYRTPIVGNTLERNANLLEWITAGLQFWTTCQYPDGSFDEAYPFERSLAATAFSAFYVSESLGFLGDALPAAERDRTIAGLRRAGEWLIRNNESHGFLSNHLAAAAAALYHVYHFTGEERFRLRSRFFIERILARQSPEGWYEEYGGADPGYQTHGSFYLARYWQLSGDEDARLSLARANRFLAHFLHPDGSIGGEYASRGTQTYYPAAFEMLAPHDGAAAWIAETMRPSVGSAAAVGLRGVDGYNYFPCLNNLVFAALNAELRFAADPAAGSGLAWFPEAGLARIRSESYEAFIGVSKGGALKVFDRRLGRLLVSDSGWVGKTSDGSTVSSHYLDTGRPVSVSPERIQTAGTFQSATRPVFSPWRFLAFRLFGLTAGRLPAAARWLKRLLVRVLITRRDSMDVASRRTILFQPDRVRVIDELHGAGATNLVTLVRAASFTSIHMGSARYFVPHEIEPMPEAASRPIDPRQVVTGVTVEYEVRVESGTA